MSLQKKCRECDRYGLEECKKQNKTVIYHCHMGLTEACAPIIQNGTVIGYLMLGHTLDKNDFDSISVNIALLPKDLGLDKAELDSALSEMKPISKNSLNSAARILEMCACYLWIKNIVRVESDKFQNELTTYINENLHSDTLTAPSLSKRFNISRSSLYSLSKQAFGMGISDYVRGQRIEKAKKLLLEGELSVCLIASECGFNTSSYFTKVFSAQVGCLPKNYAAKKIKK